MKNIIKIFCFIFFVVLIVILTLNIVYSKYVNFNEVEVSSEVANPKIYVEMEEEIIDSLNDDIISYKFSVKNYDEISSDTSFKYYISFNIDNEPLLLTLYRINGDEEEILTLEEYTTTEFEQIGLGETENFYRLEIEYDKNSEEILEDDFKISVCLTAVQEEEI